MGNCISSLQRTIAERQLRAETARDEQIDARLQALCNEAYNLVAYHGEKHTGYHMEILECNADIQLIRDNAKLSDEDKATMMTPYLIAKRSKEDQLRQCGKALKRAMQRASKFEYYQSMLLEVRSNRHIVREMAHMPLVSSAVLKDLDVSVDVEDKINEVVTNIEAASEDVLSSEETKYSYDEAAKEAAAMLAKRRQPAASAAENVKSAKVAQPKQASLAAPAPAKGMSLSAMKNQRSLNLTTA